MAVVERFTVIVSFAVTALTALARICHWPC